MKPDFLKNYYRKAVARRVFPNTAAFDTLLNFDTETGTSWQAWVFNNAGEEVPAADQGGIAHVKFSFNGGYSAQGEITTTIGPGSGDLITGQGPCRVGVNVRGGAPATVSIWFTPEQTSRALPPKTEIGNNLGTAGTRNEIGFPPFGRYRTQILSTDNYTLELEVGNTAIIFCTAILTANAFLDDANGFYHPPTGKLFLTGSVNAQRYQVTHFV
tara:strand:- start:1396 stop:2037 length:642 start_codon:yes stop_codon:yes gene_type:complete